MGKIYFKIILPIFFILNSSFQVNVNSRINYIQYFKNIQNAENLIAKGNIDEAINEYLKNLNHFEFNFGRDLYHAIQLTCLRKDKKNVFKFLHRALIEGIDIVFIKETPIIKDYLNRNQEIDRGLKLLSDTIKKDYFKKFNLNLRKDIIKDYCQCISKGNKIELENVQKFYVDYSYKNWKNKQTFIGEKYIGYFNISVPTNSCEKSSRSVFPDILVNIYGYCPCSLTKFSSDIDTLLKYGEIQPRFLALWQTMQFDAIFTLKKNFPCLKPKTRPFDYGIRTRSSEPLGFDIQSINNHRSQIYLPPKDTDEKIFEWSKSSNFKFIID